VAGEPLLVSSVTECHVNLRGISHLTCQFCYKRSLYFIPGLSQHNAQWIWASPLSETGTIERIWVVTRLQLHCINLPAPYRAVETTTTLLLALLLTRNPEARYNHTAYTPMYRFNSRTNERYPSR
jgi:hypothetical protein